LDTTDLQTLIETVRQHAAQHPMRVALITGERLVTYGELWAKVMAAAKEYVEGGIGFGDRVLLVAPSAPAFVFGYLATHFVGAVAVVLDPSAPTQRRDELIRRSAPKLVFAANAGVHPEVGRLRPIAELETLPLDETSFHPPVLESLADLLFTTGTTGHPKGVRLTHRNLAAAARQINMTIGNDEDDVEVVPLPLYHSFGLGRLRCNLIAGGTVVLVEGFRLPGEIFSAIQRHRATGLVGVPAGFAVLLRFGARGLGPFAGQLRYVEIGSAPMPLAHKRALMELLPRTALWMHYGLTEASRSVFLEFHRHASHLDSIGTPAPDVSISIRRDSGLPCPLGETGLLWIGGSHVSPGYWDDSELTDDSFRDGWVCTGDVVHRDYGGFLYLHGRKDDMINVGGFNVSPDEVEQVLAAHPSVQEAACIGIADPRDIAGQVVCAYLVPAAGHAQPDDAELSAWTAERIESYKIPLQYRWIETLPKTASGKLLRASLRGNAASEQSRSVTSTGHKTNG
jgi:long-chain acyl-CoA synthetase